LARRRTQSCRLLLPTAPTIVSGISARIKLSKTFYDFVTPRVNEKHQSRVQEFANGTLTNPTYLASAVRHLFAHGHLTAHAGGTLTEHVDRVCEILFEFHLKVMDGEFSRIVRTFRDANL
jgi:zinc transporter ZupT